MVLEIVVLFFGLAGCGCDELSECSGINTEYVYLQSACAAELSRRSERKHSHSRRSTENSW